MSRLAQSIRAGSVRPCRQFLSFADLLALPRVEGLAIAIEDSLIEFRVALRSACGVRRAGVRSRSLPGPNRRLSLGRACQSFDQVFSGRLG